MSIYDFIVAQATKLLLPPSKRKKTTLAWLGVFGNYIQYLRDLIFNTYVLGFDGENYISSSVYSMGDRVKYIDNSVYEALTSVPTSTPPDYDNTYPKGAYWIKVSDIWIGSTERGKYNGQLIMLELILNKYFNIGNYNFPFTGASHSTQIYIGKNNVINNTMWLPQDSAQPSSGYMAQDSRWAKSFMPQVSSASNSSRFTIYVPAWAYAQIGATIPAGSPDTAETLIRSLADKYIRANRDYLVVQY